MRSCWSVLEWSTTGGIPHFEQNLAVSLISMCEEDWTWRRVFLLDFGQWLYCNNERYNLHILFSKLLLLARWGEGVVVESSTFLCASVAAQLKESPKRQFHIILQPRTQESKKFLRNLRRLLIVSNELFCWFFSFYARPPLTDYHATVEVFAIASIIVN